MIRMVLATGAIAAIAWHSPLHRQPASERIAAVHDARARLAAHAATAVAAGEALSAAQAQAAHAQVAIREAARAVGR